MMNDILFFSLITIALIRLSGFLVSIEFYIRDKKSNFEYLIIGWFLYFIAVLLPLLTVIFGYPLLFFINDYFNPLLTFIGLFVLLMGYISYLMIVKARFVQSLCIFYSIISTILYFYRGNSIITELSIIAQYITVISCYSLGIYRRKIFEDSVGNSIFWFYLSASFGVSHILFSGILLPGAYNAGIYQSDSNINLIINYFFVIGGGLLLVILIIHLERNVIYKEKLVLIDKYSHDLGNVFQLIMTSIFKLENALELNENQLKEVNKIKENSIEASDLIKAIKK
jgi:hypothetical protein